MCVSNFPRCISSNSKFNSTLCFLSYMCDKKTISTCLHVNITLPSYIVFQHTIEISCFIDLHRRRRWEKRKYTPHTSHIVFVRIDNFIYIRSTNKAEINDEKWFSLHKTLSLAQPHHHTLY